MRKKQFIVLYAAAALLLAGCGTNTTDTNVNSAINDEAAASDAQSGGTSGGSTVNTSTSAGDTNVVSAADAGDQAVEITGDFEIETSVVGGVSIDNNIYTITKGGEYKLSGKLSEGSIVVDTDDDVTLILNGVSISSSTQAPINVLDADDMKIKTQEGTYNEIIDSRKLKEVTTSDSSDDEDDEAEGNAAIYSAVDLSMVGKGALVVSSTYNNGIQTKKDLSIKNVTLKVTAVNNAIKGNDSVEIESGEIIAISSGGDGIKTSDNGLTSSDKQKGIVTITGGNIDVYAACDGIDAAYSADISGEGNLNIYTDTYSDYTGTVAGATTTFYIVVDSDTYSTSSDYYAYYYNDDETDGVWMRADYISMVNSGRSRYYGLSLSVPTGYSSVAFYVFDANATPSLTDYTAAAEGGSINSTKNAYLITDVSDGTITGDWNSISSNGNSANEYSTKGIKAMSEITISGGNIYICSTDDGLHANNETRMDNGKWGNGLITINGGSITITSGDDGMHADKELVIEDGTVNVLTAYEGLEAETLTINGGSSYVYATDDGLNAGTLIQINGGYVDVTTPGGDTDAIDSNGDYEQTGGFVLVKGGASSGSVAGSIDVNGGITVTGGTTFAMGGICETPEDSVNAYVMNGQSFSAGDYELVDGEGNTILNFSLTSSYSNGWVASESLTTGTDYVLKQDGEELVSWTQEEGTMNASGTGFGGMGGGGQDFGGGNQGGFGGGGKR